MRGRISRLWMLAAVLTAWGSSQGLTAEVEKKKLTMAIAGTSTQIYFLAINVAKAHNYFKDEGLDVETVDFAGGAKALEAMIGGSADIDAGSYEHTFQMQVKGQNVQCIAQYGRSVGTVLAIAASKADSFKSIRDLKGMTVGVSAPGFSSTHIFLNLVLAKNGMKPSDVNVVGVGNGPLAFAAIQNGKIDALSSVDPVISMLTAQNLIKVIVDSRTDEGLNQAYGGDFPAGCLLATNKFIKENPATVQALANAVVRSLKFIHSAGPDQIMAILPPNIVGSDPELYRAALEKNINTVASDGLIREEFAKNTLRVVGEADPAVGQANIDLSATYTNEFTKRALENAR